MRRKTQINEEVDPILAEALARPAVRSRGGPADATPSSSKNKNGSATYAPGKLGWQS